MKRVRVLATAVLVMTLAVAATARGEPSLVDAAWLRAHLDDPDVRIIDMVSEPDDYRRAHIPGAVRLDVNDARVPVASGGYRLPTADEAARLFGRLGLTPRTNVVIYDDVGGLHASRLFFTLDVFGHPRVALLDGGVQRWRRSGHPMSRDIPAVARIEYPPTVIAERVASAEWIRARLGEAGVALVDARAQAEYKGREMLAKRGGHIPGAVNIEWRQNLRSDLTFKSADELRQLYADRGVTPDRTVVTYCQTHHRAAHTYFVLRLLGYPRVVGYDRSWAEWGNRLDLPVAR